MSRPVHGALAALGGYVETIRPGARVRCLSEGGKDRGFGIVTQCCEYSPFVLVAFDKNNDMEPQKISLDYLESVDLIELRPSLVTLDEEMAEVSVHFLLLCIYCS